MPEIINTPKIWLPALPFPKDEDNKYTRGHALIRGGAVMTGAARLAARAAQRMGAGLVTVLAPAAAVPIYAIALESVIARSCDDLAAWEKECADDKRHGILIGPGLGTDPQLAEWVLAALAARKPCVLDADALTLFARQSDRLFAGLHGNCVITPHEGEFARLFGKLIDMDAPKAERALQAAKLCHAVVLLKGHETVIASPEGEIIASRNAPAWLATGGAGDVLAGMILGLVTQGMPSFEAAAAAAWIHGEAAEHIGLGLIAEDLITELPVELQRLYKTRL